jgi:hypothetical protein
MVGIPKDWEDRANEGEGGFATAVAIGELTDEVRRLGERFDKLISLFDRLLTKEMSDAESLINKSGR